MPVQEEEEEQQEFAAEASNAVPVDVDADADESERFSRRVDERANGGVVAENSEKAPPTPAKDGGAARSVQAAVPVLASEGTSGSAM